MPVLLKLPQTQGQEPKLFHIHTPGLGQRYKTAVRGNGRIKRRILLKSLMQILCFLDLFLRRSEHLPRSQFVFRRGEACAIEFSLLKGFEYPTHTICVPETVGGGSGVLCRVLRKMSCSSKRVF